MATQSDKMTCDIQFSLRVPKSMADEITARAGAEGIKPASWIRRAISAAIISTDEKALKSLKSDLIKLIETDVDVQSAVLKIACAKDFEREKTKEAEYKFKRLRKMTESRIDELSKQKKSIQKDIDSKEKQMTSVANKISKYNPGTTETESDIRYIEHLRSELDDKRSETEALKARAAEIDAKVENAKAELAALEADAKNAKLDSKDFATAGERKVWQDDLEKLEIIEKMEDD